MNKGGYKVKRIIKDKSVFYYADHDMEILHREDGPAIEWSTGDKAWWIDGENYSEEEFKKIVNNE